VKGFKKNDLENFSVREDLKTKVIGKENCGPEREDLSRGVGARLVGKGTTRRLENPGWERNVL